MPGRGTRARDGGGVLLTQGIDTLDLMISIAGLPVEAVAPPERTLPVQHGHPVRMDGGHSAHPQEIASTKGHVDYSTSSAVACCSLSI